MTQVHSLWKTTTSLPVVGSTLGKRVFSIAFSQKAPYFASIHPRVTELRPNYAEVVIPKRRSVQNHIGTVHAIAMCNLAEVAGGIMTEASVPPDTHRWIPKGMTVSYLKKAGTDVRAVAHFPAPPVFGDEGFELPTAVTIYDTAGEAVFEAEIRMWVSPKPAKR